MSSYYWIKLYHEILNDPKMGRLSDRIWRRAIELFLLAGETNDDGMLPLASDIAWRLRTTEEKVIKDLKTLAAVGIMALNGNRWHVVNFSKRQAASLNAERQRQYRDRQRKARRDRDEDETQERQESNESITKCNANYNDKFAESDTDIESDKETDIDADSPPLAGADAAPPPPPAKQPQTKRKKKAPTPEAVRVFRENAHCYPTKSWYDDVAKAVGEEPADLEFWGRVVKAYVGCGWNKRNVKNMLDFYERREVPTTGGKGKNVDALSSSDEWFARRQEAEMEGMA